MSIRRSLIALAAILVLGIVPSVAPFGPHIPEAQAAACSPTESTFTGGGGVGTTGVVYKVLSFTSTGSCDWAVPSGVTQVDLLLIGGGGGGNGLAGGGAGEFLQRTSFSVSGTISVQVGPGGASGSSGTSSEFGSLVAAGGGPGGSRNSNAPDNSDGGSAGGSNTGSYNPGTSVDDGDALSFGNNGAKGYNNPDPWLNPVIGGGGGGAEAAPNNASYPGSVATSLGGAGKTSTIVTAAVATSLSVGEVDGEDVYFAGGGAGGCGNAGCDSAVLTGGIGGGGDGSASYSPQDGAQATGGGGGGTNTYAGTGGSGGSGVVIIRYALTTVTYDANEDQHQAGVTTGTVPSSASDTPGWTHTVSSNTGSLTRVGFTFEGWNTESDGSGTGYDPGASLTVSADTTLYAQWGIPQAARLFGQEDDDGNRTETVVAVTGYSGLVSQGGFRGMTTDGAYLYYVPAVASKNLVLKVDFDGSVVAEKEVANDSGNVLDGPEQRDLAYSSDCIFIRSSDFSDLYCVDTSDSDWTISEITVPSPGFPEGQRWAKGSILDFPDGKIAVVSANATSKGSAGVPVSSSESSNCPADFYCKVLRVFSVSGSGASVTLSHDQDILLADSESDWPGDNHGIASDGTYLFQSNHEFGYKTWALQSGVSYLAFNGDGSADVDGSGGTYRASQGHNDNCGATTGVSGGFCPINPEIDDRSGRPTVTRQMVNTTFFTRNHTTKQYLMGDYENDLSPRFLITEAATDQPDSGFTQPTPTAPGAVSGSRADGAVTVSWSASTVSGGGSISYTVTSSPGNFSCTTSSTSCQVTGLTNGTSYTFSVVATVASVNSSATVSAAVVPGTQTSGNSGSSDDDDDSSSASSPSTTPPALPGGTTPTRGLPRIPTGPTPGSGRGVFDGPVTVPGLPGGGSAGPVTRFGGVPAPTTTSRSSDGVDVRSGGVNLGVGVRGPDTGSVEVNPQTNQPELRVAPGGITRFSGGGLRPGSNVQVWLPGVLERELGRVLVNEDGVFDGEIAVATRTGEPPLPVGRRVMQVTGFDENGVETVIEMPLNIAQGPPTPEPNRQVGALPDLGPSQSIATSAGIPTSVVVTPFEQERSVAVDGGDWAITVAMADPASEVSGDEGEAFIRMAQASVGEALGTGFMPGTVASVWFFSEPTMMGTVTVSDDGSFTLEFLVSPQSIPVGDHTLQIQGVGEDGFIKAANLGVLVDAAPAETTSSNASMLLWWTLISLALLIAALIVWMVLRRRARA